jgi:hypothetical protein
MELAVKRWWNRLPYLLSFLGIWLFWMTAASTSWGRIASIQTVEPYAFAVHEQLLRNFSASGEFSQTIHAGYDDNWTWSGHRALTLPITGLFYGLSPSALWLSMLMISGIALGALPAGGIGRRAMGSSWGFLWGSFVYISAPASMALSLQDYQDLCLALPCLVFAIWAIGSGRWWLVLLGTLVGIAPREECVPIVVAIAMLCVPFRGKRIRWGLWIRNAILVALVAGAYAYWAETRFPISTSGHDMPLQNAVRSLGKGQIFLEGWLYRYRFYALVWVPLGTLAIFSPFIALPGVALCILHMSVPEGHGVDRSWSLHCHHMAPAIAFSVASVILGGARLLRWTRRAFPRSVGRFLCASMLAGLAAWSGWWWSSWSEYYNLVPSYQLTEPEWEHPAWSLMRQLPDGAVPLVSKKVSIVVSHFPRSYTFDESLYSKEPHRGLARASHIIYDHRRDKVTEWIKRMPSYEVLAEDYPFVLATWSLRANDAGFRPRFSKVHAWTGPYSKGSDIPGVPPHEKRKKVRLNGSFPVIQLWPQGKAKPSLRPR